MSPLEPGWRVLVDVRACVAALHAEDAESFTGRIAIDRVAVGIAEEQITRGHPDRTFDEFKAFGHSLQPCISRHDLVETGILLLNLQNHALAYAIERLEELDGRRTDPDEVRRRIR